jgi:flavin reductase (DIM6/NTAB) family NADH-FMN oxidoreductase RutF
MKADGLLNSEKLVSSLTPCNGEASGIKPEHFRKVMSRFATGVTVVTSRAGGRIHGMTCNAFCSISDSSMCILVSLATNTRTERMIRDGRVFAVNVLSESQGWLSDRFAGRHQKSEDNRFRGVEFGAAITGAPILSESVAYLDCRVLKAYKCDTHRLFLGNVIAFDAHESRRPLIFFGSQYMALSP